MVTPGSGREALGTNSGESLGFLGPGANPEQLQCPGRARDAAKTDERRAAAAVANAHSRHFKLLCGIQCWPPRSKDILWSFK